MIKGNYMREIFKQIIRMAMVYKFIQMGMFILVISRKIKNMVKDNFIGLAYHLLLKKMHYMCNFMMEDGGVVYLMVLVRTRNQQEISMTDNSKMV